ncbi:MAG TPA: antitoxin family protein [Blastocatellia bacterium]|jgi:predicted DNA-binding antitoxin AbrB/MazE fold protein|nr:antitoxin family protein [Blastocatellia bacterium]
MSDQVEAIYENGVFRPLDKVDLQEGERVHITVMGINESTNDPAYNLGRIAEETGISDLATNIDHYLGRLESNPIITVDGRSRLGL